MNAINFVVSNWDSILGLLGVLGIYKHQQGKKQGLDDLWDTLLQFGRQAFIRLLEHPKLTDDGFVRAYIERTIWMGLERLQVKRTKTVEDYVKDAVEHIHGELAQRVWDLQMSRLKREAIPALERAAQKLEQFPPAAAEPAQP